MPPRLTINLLRTLFVVFCAYVGATGSDVLYHSQSSGLVLGTIFGLCLVLIDRLLKGFSLRAFSSATFGLFLGFLAASLLRASDILKFQSEEVQWIVSLCLYATLGYLGMMLAMRSHRDEFSLLIPYVRFAREGKLESPVVLDTNAVIDGRVADICAAGFLSRTLVTPRCVLDELQHLAVSPDPLRRERGRRGLENLERMRDSPKVDLSVHEHQMTQAQPTDVTLVQLAQILGARILTNDTELAKIARLRGVEALNLNELTRALRPVVAPGDEIEVLLVKEGRDPHQGVGYLPDGTMVVVNHASEHIGKTIPVIVASALQTSAGRLFFAERRSDG